MLAPLQAQQVILAQQGRMEFQDPQARLAPQTAPLVQQALLALKARQAQQGQLAQRVLLAMLDQQGRQELKA